MKVLTVRQPYAWLIIAGHKPIENRTWTVDYRGPILIHAGTKLHDTPIAAIERRFSISIPADLQFGGVIGRVDLIDIVTRSDLAAGSKWFDGPFGWMLARPQSLPFRPLRGRQGLFDV